MELTPCDVTGDCKVNVLDLVVLRNHLNQDVGLDDNWKYDVDVDGHINVIDLIWVRNNIGTKCQ